MTLTEGDTLFSFNYRSDRIRELISVLGLPDKPMEVEVPEDLVSTEVNGVGNNIPKKLTYPPPAHPTYSTSPP